MNYVITLKIRNGPLDTDPLIDAAELPAMTDETATYGVKEADGGTVVVAADSVASPQKMTHTATGTYTFTFAGAEDLQYIYSIKFKVGVGPYQFVEGVKGPWTQDPDVPTSAYTTYDGFVQRWGETNVRLASNKDNKNTEVDTDAVQRAFAWADAEINGTLTGGIWTVPLVFTAYANVVDYTVREWADVLAFRWLYNSKGFLEKSTMRNKIEALYREVRSDMLAVKNGHRQINAGIATDTAGNYVTPTPGTYTPSYGYRNADGTITLYFPGFTIWLS